MDIKNLKKYPSIKCGFELRLSKLEELKADRINYNKVVQGELTPSEAEHLIFKEGGEAVQCKLLLQEKSDTLSLKGLLGKVVRIKQPVLTPEKDILLQFESDIA